MDYQIRFEISAIAAGGGLAAVLMRVFRPRDDMNVIYTVHSFSSGGLLASRILTDWIRVSSERERLPVITEPGMLKGYLLSLEIKKNVLSLQGAPNYVQVMLETPNYRNLPPQKVFDIEQQVLCEGFGVGGFKIDGTLYGGYLRGERIAT